MLHVCRWPHAAEPLAASAKAADCTKCIRIGCSPAVHGPQVFHVFQNECAWQRVLEIVANTEKHGSSSSFVFEALFQTCLGGLACFLGTLVARLASISCGTSSVTIQNVLPPSCGFLSRTTSRFKCSFPNQYRPLW